MLSAAMCCFASSMSRLRVTQAASTTSRSVPVGIVNVSENIRSRPSSPKWNSRSPYLSIAGRRSRRLRGTTRSVAPSSPRSSSDVMPMRSGCGKPPISASTSERTIRVTKAYLSRRSDSRRSIHDRRSVRKSTLAAETIKTSRRISRAMNRERTLSSRNVRRRDQLRRFFNRFRMPPMFFPRNPPNDTADQRRDSSSRLRVPR